MVALHGLGTHRPPSPAVECSTFSSQSHFPLSVVSRVSFWRHVFGVLTGRWVRLVLERPCDTLRWLSISLCTSLLQKVPIISPTNFNNIIGPNQEGSEWEAPSPLECIIRYTALLLRWSVVVGRARNNDFPFMPVCYRAPLGTWMKRFPGDHQKMLIRGNNEL